MAAPPARTELADTYPNPSNAVFRIGIGKLWDFVTERLGTGATVADSVAALGLTDRSATTGDFKLVARSAAPSGWIAGLGQTIGNTGSGATVTGAAYQALFNAWWADYSDALLPILTSAGGASTRGASAAADWSAGKRLTVFDVRDRVPRMAGTLQVNGAKLDATEIVDNGGSSGTIIVPLTGQMVTNSDGAGAGPVAGYNAIATGGATSSNLSNKKVRVASIGMLGCFKL